MFSKLSALLHQAAELSSQILASDSSAQEEFKQHWKEVTNAITDRGSVALIKRHLSEMLDLLSLEEETVNPGDPGTVGPCLEMVLRHKILDTLYTTATNNYPAGMAYEALNFFSMLLSRLERPLLHHVSIRQPILMQVGNCGDSSSTNLSIYEVQFIRTLCIRLTKDPRLADFFIKGRGEFVLLSALLKLANASDHHVVMKSYESILTCASLQHSSVTAALASSHLPVLLASKLQYHFQLITESTKFTSIWSCCARWGHCSGPEKSYNDLEHVEALFSWLDFCEQVISVSQKALAQTVCQNIHEVFLRAAVLPKLLKSKEEEILLATSVLAHAIEVVSSQMLLEELVFFIIRDSLPVVSDETGVVQHVRLIDKLIQRIDHINEDVCHVTLQLFDILLRAPFPLLIEELTHCSLALPKGILQDDMIHSARVQLEQDTVSYLSLIPDSILSKNQSVEELNQYLREAHSKVARTYEELNRRSPYSGDHSDTSFLLMLLSKLESMLNQPYEINLLVTSIFAQLAALPSPAIEAFFHTSTHKRNVYTILKKVAETFQLRVERTPGLIVHIVEARRRLEGLPTSDLLSMPHNDLLEGCVVLQEFIKELCAILYAKNSWTILALPMS